MEKLNIAEMLKDCPKGMELDCTMYNNVEFDYVEQSPESKYPIHCLMKTNSGYNALVFTHYGYNDRHPNAKCVIFPKGKTTWEGFQRPFKDGDVVVCEDENITQMFILKSQTYKMWGYCYTGYDFKNNKFFDACKWCFNRLATEEERQKLFDIIKANGYKWNAETKTLEKLIVPKFKVGDRITNGKVTITIGYIDDEYYYESGKSIAYRICINVQDNWQLAKFDISTLKPFDKVLVRNDNFCVWKCNLYSHYSKYPYHYICIDTGYKQCIPYEGNEHLLGTTNDCVEYYKTWE